MTAWRILQRAAEGTHRLPPSPELRAVGLDEFHVRVRGRSAWFLVSRGATAAGGGHYLGAVLSEDRSQASWELALDSLGLSNIPPQLPLIADGDAALEAAVSRCLPGRRLSRCAWHVLHNVLQWLQERLPGQATHKQRLRTRIPRRGGPPHTTHGRLQSWQGARNFARLWMLKETPAPKDWTGWRSSCPSRRSPPDGIITLTPACSTMNL